MLVALMNAPVDDEPETDDERRAVAEATRELEAGEGIPHQEAGDDPRSGFEFETISNTPGANTAPGPKLKR